MRFKDDEYVTLDVFAQLQEDFVDFLKHEVSLDVEKSECLIPITIGELIEKGEANSKAEG